METSDLILIKGEPKTQQIVSINEDRNGVYWVRFSNGKTQIWEYRHHFHRYYRIEFESGELKEYDENY